MADNYFIVIDREKVFVSEEVYKTYQQMKRQERTQSEKDARNGLISYEMFTTERICYAIHYSQALKRLRSLPSCAASCIYALISYLRKNESS